MYRMTLAVVTLAALCAATALTASAATIRCNTTCGYGVYRCLSKERSRTYTLQFSPDARSVTVHGGEAPGTFDVRKGAFSWRWLAAAGKYHVSYTYRHPHELKVDISYTTKTANGGMLFETNYYTGFCSRL